ncbi:hypothetical protein [Cryobacterium sp. GrIS_2_6]|uniref:hypothetical protein n=1 Tax=Cryobacterium sp. GrIS_2_6 TaxID=3162785 RepID=UPI002E06B32E|nr:hypothetical protein [Cryobacterium psychrotolerans]
MDDGFTGWGAELGNETIEGAKTARRISDRNRLALQLGLDGSDTFSIFERLTALDAKSEDDELPAMANADDSVEVLIAKLIGVRERRSSMGG